MPTEPESPAREAALAMAPAQFRALGHALVDRIADMMAALPQRPVSHGETPGEVRARVGDGPLPTDRKSVV